VASEKDHESLALPTAVSWRGPGVKNRKAEPTSGGRGLLMLGSAFEKTMKWGIEVAAGFLSSDRRIGAAFKETCSSTRTQESTGAFSDHTDSRSLEMDHADPTRRSWCRAFLSPPRRGRNRKAQGNALGKLGNRCPRKAPSPEGAQHCSRLVVPFQGDFDHAIQFPGRCPGLTYSCPFGAKSKQRNTKTRASRWYAVAGEREEFGRQRIMTGRVLRQRK
jgi:hypothetical protein